MPGNAVRCGALKMNCRPSPSIVPHSAVGDWTPRPRNPSPAASRMLTPMLSVACTSTGVSELRNTCRTMIRRSLAPSPRAASTKGSSRRLSTDERTSRTITGMTLMPTAMITFCRLTPSTATRVSASRMLVKANSMSANRETAMSAQPP